MIGWLVVTSTVLVAWPVGAALPGDANCDGIVDGLDVAALTESVFDGHDGCPDADTNQDGLTNAPDLSALLAVLSAQTSTAGPIVTFFGVASSAGGVSDPVALTDDQVPIYWRPSGVGFKLAIEAAVGTSGKPIGRALTPSSGRPDLQIETDRVLGDGSYDACPGVVPAIDPADFGPGARIDEALRAFACGFQVTTTRASACTLDLFGNPNWVAAATQVQFCLQIQSLRQFQSGQTRLTVRLRDTDGHLGPAQRMVVQVGAMPQGTSTPTRTRTPIATATRVPTASPTATPSPLPPATATRTGTALLPTATKTPSPFLPSPSMTARPPTTASATATARPSESSPTNTASRTPSRSPTASATVSRTFTPSLTRSPTAPVNTPTRTRTDTPLPGGSPSPTRTATLRPSSTPTRSFTAQLTSTPTRTRTRTLTPSPTSSPAPGSGPVVAFLGIANANDTVATPVGTTTDGIPIYERSLGSSFTLVVEGTPGSSRKSVGTSVFMYDPGDPTLRPDLQVQVNRSLGDGSSEVCDNTLPTIGGIPGISPPSFEIDPAISAALSDIGCRFVDGSNQPGGRTSQNACTTFLDGSFHFVHAKSTIQFCAPIVRPFGFPSGETLVTVQLRDGSGNIGPQSQMIVRVP